MFGMNKLHSVVDRYFILMHALNQNCSFEESRIFFHKQRLPPTNLSQIIKAWKIPQKLPKTAWMRTLIFVLLQTNLANKPIYIIVDVLYVTFCTRDREYKENVPTCWDNFVMSTGLIFLRADSLSKRSLACCSTAITKAS